jgi:hypothetical protein
MATPAFFFNIIKNKSFNPMKPPKASCDTNDHAESDLKLTVKKTYY